MRITDSKAPTVSVPLEVPMRHAARSHPRRFVRTIVQVFTNEGITGLNVFGMDEEAAHGGLEAVQEMGIDDSKIVLCGFGLAGDEGELRLQKPSPWKASLAMFPGWVGFRCGDQAVKVFNGQQVQLHDVIPTIPVSQQSLTGYSSQQPSEWTPNFPPIASLPLEDRSTKKT